MEDSDSKNVEESIKSVKIRPIFILEKKNSIDQCKGHQECFQKSLYCSKDPDFSYTCSQMNLKSTKENDESKIALGPYQIQPFCSDKCNKFTVSVVDCVPLMGEMVWATFLGFLLFSSILAGAVWAMLAIESPTRFETARSKPLIIPDHSQ